MEQPPRRAPGPQPNAPSQTSASDETVMPTTPPEELPEPEIEMASSNSQTVPNKPVQPKNIRQAGLTTLGDFKIIKKLGAGAMGEVYKAHQISLDREVALKVLSRPRSKDKSFVERFLREARLMARLDHPNVIRSFGVGEQDGWHYLAMEFVDGGTIEDWLKKADGRFSLADSLHVILACAEGLKHAHELKFVHRDIKPGNVLVSTKGVVKVADLGLAKATDEDLSLTTSGVGAGTPYYMSPEQTRNAKHVDGRSDIYALGCMLYLFLVGDHPFKGNTPLELIEAKEKGKFTPARRANDEVPARLDLIIDKMLARDPNTRYQTCAELIADLEGLELAGDRLSFLGDSAQPAAKPAAKQPAGKKPAPATQVPAKPSAPKAPVNDVWFVKYRAEGKRFKKRMSTAQVKEALMDPDFDLEAEASRDANDGYRKLATYREFGSVLQGRLAKAKADRKVSQMREMYGDLVQQDRRNRRWRWFKGLFGSFMGWVWLTIWLVVVGVVLFALFHGITFLIDFAGKKFAS
jgi:serine/threonine-protein kinase